MSPGLIEQDILRILDAAAFEYEFPMLDNGYLYPVDVRLSAYGDGARRWAMAIECIGVHNQVGIANDVDCYGNCLTSLRSEADYVTPEAYAAWRAGHQFWETMHLHPVQDGPSGSLVADGLEVIGTDLSIRGRVVDVPRYPRLYATRGATVDDPKRIQLHELMRFLAPEHRPRLLATEEEIHRLVPTDLPLLLRLDEWAHPELADDETPGESETFQMIARVMATGDPSHYRPTRPANTHWSNWPDGGTL